jgi:hypothetical protein
MLSVFKLRIKENALSRADFTSFKQQKAPLEESKHCWKHIQKTPGPSERKDPDSDKRTFI